jgi:hypothetical protein
MSNGVVNIHGREYKTVALRVSEFKDRYPDWSILTDLVSADSEVVVMKATIMDDVARVRGTGYAEEYRSSSKINRTSAMENAETSAIGRALAACGLAGTEYASADEVANAISQQNQEEALKPLLNMAEVLRENFASVAFIKESLMCGDYDAAAEAEAEMERDDLVALWVAPSKGGVWTTEERAKLKSDEMNAARKNYAGEKQ